MTTAAHKILEDIIKDKLHQLFKVKYKGDGVHALCMFSHKQYYGNFTEDMTERATDAKHRMVDEIAGELIALWDSVGDNNGSA